MLKIIEAHDQIRVETIVAVFYAPPGIGKTSLGFASNKPLMLDTDKGSHRSAFRKRAVRPDTWADIAGIEKGDVEGYETLVIDTVGRALDLLTQDIIAKNPKHGFGGALTLQGYGQLKTRFAAYLKLVRSFGLDVVLIAHSEEKQQGDELIERLDIQGGSKQEVFKSADSMARLGIKNGQRFLMFSPTETQFGKDPAGIGSVEVPDFAKEPQFLGKLIERIKDALNAQSDEMVAEAKKRSEWGSKVLAANTPSKLSKLVEKCWDRRAKVTLWDRAKSLDFTWQKGPEGEVGKFVGPEPEPEPTSEPEPESEPDVPEESESDKQSLPF